jgi:hypothetical protein
MQLFLSVPQDVDDKLTEAEQAFWKELVADASARVAWLWRWGVFLLILV